MCKLFVGNIKIRLYWLAILLSVVVNCAHSTPVIGTTVLLYGESAAQNVLVAKFDQTKPNDPANKIIIRRYVLNEIVKQMPGFQGVLDNILTESAAFSVYDANVIVNKWASTDPKLLGGFLKTTSISIPISESAANRTSAESSVIPPHRFVLLGWVDSIYEQEKHTLVEGSNKEAHIYNLDIRCEYRLVNPENNRVVATFVAAGHGGIARILGEGHPAVVYDAHLIVNDMFTSLAQDIRHLLLIQEDEYIKKQRRAAKIELSKPQSAK